MNTILKATELEVTHCSVLNQGAKEHHSGYLLLFDQCPKLCQSAFQWCFSSNKGPGSMVTLHACREGVLHFYICRVYQCHAVCYSKREGRTLTSTKDALMKTDPMLGTLTYRCFPETVEVRCTVRHYSYSCRHRMYI